VIDEAVIVQALAIDDLDIARREKAPEVFGSCRGSSRLAKAFSIRARASSFDRLDMAVPSVRKS
jgi:3-methyladenine DNA glycosylase Mpg